MNDIKILPTSLLKKIKNKKYIEIANIENEIKDREFRKEDKWRHDITNLFLKWAKNKRFIRVYSPTYEYNGKMYYLESRMTRIILNNESKKEIKKLFPDILKEINKLYGKKTKFLFYYLYTAKLLNQSEDGKHFKYALVLRMTPITE
jgi:hypothetical protein